MASFSNSNTRVFYATQAVAIGEMGNTLGVVDSFGLTTGATNKTGKSAIVHGVQSIGIDTNFNLEQAFELGQLSLYENIEDIPDISVSMQKFLDGYSLIYHLGASYTDAAGDGNELAETKTTLSGRADTRADVRMVINATTDEAVTSGDSAVAELYCSGMYLSSLSYTIPTDGTCTEDVGFVGNNKKWITTDNDGELLLVRGTGVGGGADGVNIAFAGIFGSNDPAYNSGGRHVLRREDVVTSGEKVGHTTGGNRYTTVLPDVIEGVGTSPAIANTVWASLPPSGAGQLNPTFAHVNSFTCSTDLGREQINQLGTRTPYNRYVTFPTEVTSTIEVVAIAGDNINAVETARSNLNNHEICVALKDSTVLHLGKKNKVASVSYGGGDAGGGNATITYNFSNFNDLVVLHSGDPIRDTASYWLSKF